MGKMEDMQLAYGETLSEIGEDKRVVVLDSDLRFSNRTEIFARRFPERFFESGIAEANMIGVSAGLSAVGLIPFVHTFAVFVTGRVYDQIRVSVCYQKSNVKIVGTSAGLSDFGDGATHQCVEDIALMRALPNMIVIAPCDSTEARKACSSIHRHVGPAYLRLNRNPLPVVWQSSDECDFEIGKALTIREGYDVGIVATGYPVGLAKKAAEQAEKEGISVEVLDLHTVKPIDHLAIAKIAQKTGALVTIEEHNILGGVGSAVCETIVENIPVPLERIGVRDLFGESALDYNELLKAYEITVEAIVASAKKVIKRK